MSAKPKSKRAKVHRFTAEEVVTVVRALREAEAAEDAGEQSGVHSQPSESFPADEAGTMRTSEPPAAAETPDPFAFEPGECLMFGGEHDASIPALFAAALAPCESVERFAAGALDQIANELAILTEIQENGDLNERIIDRFRYAIGERARVAAEVVYRMRGAEARKGAK